MWEITPSKNVTINNYFLKHNDISYVWKNLIFSVPITLLFENHNIIIKSVMRPIYYKLIDLIKKGVLRI